MEFYSRDIKEVINKGETVRSMNRKVQAIRKLPVILNVINSEAKEET